MNIEINKLITNLNKNNMAGYFIENRTELNPLLSKLIPKHSSVGCGDSVTLEETGVFEFLRKGDYEFLDKFHPSLSRDAKRSLYLKNFTADTFITGSNAITMDGKIYSLFFS